MTRFGLARYVNVQAGVLRAACGPAGPENGHASRFWAPRLWLLGAGKAVLRGPYIESVRTLRFGL